MNNREFVSMVKHYALDNTVEEITRELMAPRPLPEDSEPANPMFVSLEKMIRSRAEEEHRRSAWFNRLPQDEQTMVLSMVEECASTTLFSLFSLIDGVGGDYIGAFEIVAVDEDERTVINPEDTEMLHDLLSDVIEEDRENQKAGN